MSKDRNNQPAVSAERIEPKGVVENFYKQPEVGENLLSDNSQSLINQAAPILYECNLCSKKYHRFADLTNHNVMVHNHFNFTISPTCS